MTDLGLVLAEIQAEARQLARRLYSPPPFPIHVNRSEERISVVPQPDIPEASHAQERGWLGRVRGWFWR